MADLEQLNLLKHGVADWNTWRQLNPYVAINLGGADLGKANLVRRDLAKADLSDAMLRGAELGDANLSEAVLSRANLDWANLAWATLSGADLRHATLMRADLASADLRRVDLRGANLTRTHFGSANLAGANLDGALLLDTVFAATNLRTTRGLETCNHVGPSSLDHRTLAESGELPLAFLRGVGLPERLIKYLPSLRSDAIQFYACFISYSARDDEFTRRLHADLQDRGVRCWFAPEDLKTGARIRHGIDEAIRVHDKLLLILSEHSIASQWVEQEVEDALEQERQTGKTILFPIRLDDAVMTISSGWPRLLRNTRNIGDMRQWKDHDAYQIVLDRLLRDLRTENAAPAPRTEA